MFFHQDIKGADLPPKTICFTYDDGPGETAGDGPGPRTLAVGRFLHDEGVPAAFFVVGRHAEQYLSVLPRLAGWGHLVGNHTYSHPGLVALADSGGDVAGELARTDEIIAPFTEGPVRYFRAPYGNWRRTKSDGSDEETSVVADLLNASGRFRNYVGPVNWDVVGEDWECWRQELSMEEAIRRHLDAIEKAGQGILLLHDSSEEEFIRVRNRTAELTMRLVPELKRRGYRFVRLDETPQARAAVGVR